MHSTDYHDYVFKDGALVGEFDAMYQHSKEIPWHQDKTAHAIFSNIDIVILKQYAFDSICEVGCGLGYFSERLYQELKTSKGTLPHVTGIDISATATQKAKSFFPHLEFYTADLTKERPFSGKTFDLIVVKEIFWYIFKDCKIFLRNVCSMLNKGGYLYVSQCFPESKEWVGKDVIDSPETLKGILSEFSTSVFTAVEVDRNYNNRPLLHYLGQVR